jgi:hypothetical protein
MHLFISQVDAEGSSGQGWHKKGVTDVESGRIYHLELDAFGYPKKIVQALHEAAETAHGTSVEAINIGYVAVELPHESLPVIISAVGEVALSVGEQLELDVIADRKRQMGVYGGEGTTIGQDYFTHKAHD